MPKTKKLRNVAKNIATQYRERPVEMLIATAAVITAGAKLTNAIIETQNAATWRREVKRRENKDQD